MTRVFAIAVFILAFVISGYSQELCKRYSDPAAGVSICTPTGWAIEDSKDGTEKMLFAPTVNNFTANINFKVDDSSLSLKEYSDANVEYILKNYEKMGATSIKLVSRADFTTESKESGNIATYSTLFKGILIRTSQFIFDTGKKKYLVTCTALESEQAVNDKLFEATLKTLQIIR